LCLCPQWGGAEKRRQQDETGPQASMHARDDTCETGAREPLAYAGGTAAAE